MTVHGGDVWQVADELGIVPAELLDFSANINPRGLPPRALERLARDAADARLLACYPDRSALQLRRVLSERLSVPMESIVIGPGAEALLAPALRSSGASAALVPVPAFSEYRRVCAQEGVEFVPFPLDESNGFQLPMERLLRALTTGRYGAAILNNPHNPSGAFTEAREMRLVRDTGSALVLDEAFIDYAPGHSLAQEAASREGLIVIRSLTKFYGCPALRAGYAIAHPRTVRRISAGLPAWPVMQLAIDAFAEALRDDEYAEATHRENGARREALAQGLGSLGLRVLPSAANYLLFELAAGMPASSELRMRLACRHSILIRNCDSYEGLEQGRWVRVAVRTSGENERLLRALAAELRPR